MDILQLDKYRTQAQIDLSPFNEFRSLPLRNQSISQQARPFEIFALAEKAQPSNAQKSQPLESDAQSAEKLRAAMEHFRILSGIQDPWAFLSKYAFAESVLTLQSPAELILRFLTDRSFYFEQYRELGNLPGNAGHPPAVSISEFIEDDDLWSECERLPSELLAEGLAKMKNAMPLGGAVSDDSPGTAHESTSSNPVASELAKKIRWRELATETFQQMIDPPPRVVILPDAVIRVFHEKCDKVQIARPDAETLKRLFGGYRYTVEYHQMVKATFEKEWIPTNVHWEFYKEADENYRQLLDEIQRREDDMQSSDRLLRELNELTKRVASTSNRDSESFSDLPQPVRRKLPVITGIFETYARSQLHVARRKEFMPVLSWQDCPNRDYDRPYVWNKPYTASLCRLLEACWTENVWHILTPLLLYHAFAKNSRVILGNSKPKLVKKIVIPKAAASIRTMASATGYRAGINLVLWDKLCYAFPGTGVYCLLQRTSQNCEKTTALPQIRNRVDVSHCVWQTRCGQGWCPFGRSARQWNNFGFYLTTGYSALYYHHGVDDTIKIPYDEIYREKRELPETEAPEDAEACFAAEQTSESAPLYAVYQYVLNLKKPVSELEGLIERHIRNCIPNRPQNLSRETPNSYRTDILHPPSEELANFLLQDMHLPAMRRMSRHIKQILSSHPEYLESFRIFLRYPWASDYARDALSEIVGRHRLKELVPRYAAYPLSSRSYFINDSLYAVLEFEIRAQLIEALHDKLRTLAHSCIDSKLFAYPPSRRKPRKPKLAMAEPDTPSE